MICKPARISSAMNGVVFQTSAMTTANRAGHCEPVHRILVLNRLLATPVNAKMKNHSLAVTAVGIDQGTRTLARSSPRPLKARAITSAIHMPRTTSITTEATVKKMVAPMAGQNCEPSVPGGHLMSPHRWKIQWV
jgi:hypothetical protein